MRTIGLAVATFVASFVLSGVVLTTAKASTESSIVSAIRQSPQVCPVSGETVTNLAKAPRYMYAGKMYYFCCEDCKEKFVASPSTYTRPKSKKASCCEGGSCGDKSEKSGGCCGDKQATHSGSTTASAKPSEKLICPVSGEELEVATAVAFEYNGKTYYTCCNSCKSKFLADPATYAKKAESLSALQGKPVSK